MSQALKEAYKARDMEEVPVGAVVVKDNKIIARGFNRCVTLSDPSAHAEILVLKKAARKLRNYRLNGCYIYVTIEPCIMCFGALINARLKRIIFGAFNGKSGACMSIFRMGFNKELNHEIEIVGGKKKYLSTQCADVIQKFFKEKR
ncbi:MAG: tRNA adenosine(34) deaminase TadA [Endomicrobium sp.]|jgi:tRNA(adenine34) deaminase|nr:tRNA adenosine(34) deaminase TadA [Endomicrobium sp.]